MKTITLNITLYKRVLFITTFRLSFIAFGALLMYLTYNYDMSNTELFTTASRIMNRVGTFVLAIMSFAMAFVPSARDIVKMFSSKTTK